ncbi:MAG: UDP-N-acetylmuramoyl-tripeptide--D-alanyl-D-alanine ligase [Burkholderiaceae bacterium]|nr:UDP-N-acetylmuramoyl-tripeptide--D-alanyl-D-alanine ligase [Burkholderiaceae bacterium]
MTSPSFNALLPRLRGATLVGEPLGTIARVHTDTRSLQPGDLFVALRGDTFDAHRFLSQAAVSGAVAAIAEQGLAAAGLPGVEVPDSRLALGELATLWRTKFTLPLVAVTGSNGKTTVTQMLASILRCAAGGDGSDALATQGNLNNDIGVPHTLLRLRPHHRLAVVELGMNHPGEIATLAAMAQPTVALVNDAQREHQEFMGTVEAVARENGAAIAALPADGMAVFPCDDAYTSVWQALAGERRTLTFSDTDPAADVRAHAEWQGLAWHIRLFTPLGEADVRLAVAGQHNVRNALAACACALAAGVSLAHVIQGLEAFEAVKGRSLAFSLPAPGGALTVVDDSYNANPDSVRAAIDLLATLPEPRTLVLGDMGEVGDQALAFHVEVLSHALDAGLQAVHCTGTHMGQAVAELRRDDPRASRIAAATDMADLMLHSLRATAAGGSVVVKGSRFMKMERIVQALQLAWPSAASAAAQGGCDAH